MSALWNESFVDDDLARLLWKISGGHVPEHIAARFEAEEREAEEAEAAAAELAAQVTNEESEVVKSVNAFAAVVPAAVEECFTDARQSMVRVTTTQGMSDFPVPLPLMPERNAVAEFPVIEKVDVQTYDAVVPVVNHASSPHANATAFADQLLKTAQQQIRQTGSEAASAASIIGQEVLASTEASIRPYMIQAQAAYLNTQMGFGATGTEVAANHYVVEVAGAPRFMMQRPDAKPIYLPNMATDVFGAFLALLRPGGIGAYQWTDPNKPGIRPINSLRSYPTGYHDEVVVVVQDGSHLARVQIPVDHTALTARALEGLIRWYDTWCNARFLWDSVYHDVAALSFGYGEVMYDPPDSAGAGLRYARQSRACVGADAGGEHQYNLGVGRLPYVAADNPVVDENIQHTIVPQLSPTQVGMAIQGVFRAFRRDCIDGHAIVQLDGEADEEYEARCHQATLNTSLSSPSEAGLHMAYIANGLSYTADVSWHAVRHIDWGDAALEGEIGAIMRKAVSAMLRLFDPGIHNLADPVVGIEGDGYDLSNIYGQWFGASMYYPEPKNDGVLAVFAGIATLAPGGSRELGVTRSRTKGPAFVMSGPRLVDVMHRYAVRLHWFSCAALYIQKMDHEEVVRTALRGPAHMRLIVRNHRNHIFPADSDDRSWRGKQILSRENGAHIKMGKSTPFVAYEALGSWDASDGSIRMRGLQHRDAIIAVDTMVRMSYQNGLLLANATRAAQIAIMRTPGNGNSMIYHAFNIPFNSSTTGGVYKTSVNLAGQTSALPLAGNVPSGRQVTFINN